jgi:hypothetical protein
MTQIKNKTPWPYFGGKSRVAPLIWERLGDCDNVIEPFCGSAAFLLARPHPPRIETINDMDCFVSNAWRALKHDPEGVAGWADSRVDEADLHASHRWLMSAFPQPEVVPAEFADDERLTAAYLKGWRDSYGEFDSAAFRKRVRADVDYYDSRVAGLWIAGACCWIGSGWCETADSEAMPKLAGGGKKTLTTSYGGSLIHADKVPDVPDKRPLLAGPANEHGQRSHYGLGVHEQGPSEKRPLLGGRSERDNGHGVHRVTKDMRPQSFGLSDAHRPQLADAYSRGRGVHGHDEAGTCDQRRAWLIDWFGRLRDRLRTVRVCCGDFMRVIGSPSVTTRLGLTGIYFDPPYRKTLDDGTENRSANLYSNDGSQDVNEVVKRVLAYCLEHGDDPLFRIIASSYEGEGFEVLLEKGWECVAWKSSGGYGNRSAKGKENAKRERLWVSPHCVKLGDDLPLFAGLDSDND